MKKIFTLLVSLSLMSSVWAVVADPTPFAYTLENGETVMAVMHGDEYHSYITDMSGNIISGTKPDAATCEQIRQRRIQNQKMIGGNFPLTGSPKSVVILINFQDEKFQYTRQDFWNMLNESGYNYNGATGSCRDYFIACSDSIFSPQFDVYGPYTVSKEMAYYGANTGDKHGTNEKEAFIEAANLAEDDGVDFSQYDTDGDGLIDNVFFYYAGHNEAEGASANTIWPHSSNLSYYNIILSDKKLATYACTSELKGASGSTMAPIGTFCHEFGHVLGLPDWYDTDDSNTYTIGGWSIMSSGNYNNNGRTPPSYCCYERFYLGWLVPQQLTEAGHYYLNALTESNSAYLIAVGQHNLSSRNPDPSEFFMLENRQKTGWDEPNLPGTGMLVWHIDFSSSAWANNTPNNGTPMRMHLEEAGGRHNSESATDPYPGTKKVNTFGPMLHDGTMLTDQPVYNIQEHNTIIDFIYKGEGEQKLHADPNQLDMTTYINDDDVPEDWSAYALHLYGDGLNPGDTVKIASASPTFRLTANEKIITRYSSSSWTTKLNLDHAVSTDSTLDTVIYVGHFPSKRTCEMESNLLTVQAGSYLLTVPVSGIATRKTQVYTPVLKEESALTPYSFCINWKPIEDAAVYYFTVFQSEDGKTDFVQDFEDFGKQSAIKQQGWQSTTTKTSTAFKKDGHTSLIIEKNSDSIVSEIYQAPISHIQYWINALSTDADTVGLLQIDALDKDGNWDNIQALTVLKNSRNKTIGQDLAEDKGYIQFRFSYQDLGGKGLALDAFTATCNKKITYLYRERELCAAAGDSSRHISGLTPDTRYEYQIQCTDLGKGCEEHLTKLSESRIVTTLSGDSVMSWSVDTTGNYQVYVKEIDAEHTLYVYDTGGHLIYTTQFTPESPIVTLPEGIMIHGNVYILKYTLSNKLKRKDVWKKFVYLSRNIQLTD